MQEYRLGCSTEFQFLISIHPWLRSSDALLVRVPNPLKLPGSQSCLAVSFTIPKNCDYSTPRPVAKAKWQVGPGIGYWYWFIPGQWLAGSWRVGIKLGIFEM